MINWFEKHYILSIIIATLIAIFIFYMSSKSFEKGTPVDFPFKTIAYHFLIFSLLSFFISVSLVGKTKNIYFVVIAILISISYGIFDELHQLFVPNRYCSINDVFIDSFGIITTNLFYILIRRTKQHQTIF